MVKFLALALFWFIAPLALLRQWDWPGPDLRHAGGDIVLGALLHQQGLEPEQFQVGLAINADEDLRQSAARRRGITAAADGPAGPVWGPH